MEKINDVKSVNREFYPSGVEKLVGIITKFEIMTNAPIGEGTRTYGQYNGGYFTETGHYIFPEQIESGEVVVDEI